MKKFIFTLFAFFGVAGAMTAQKVSVDNVEAVPGETVKATLNISCPADTYTGMQVRLQFPAEGFSVAEADALTGWKGSIEYSMKEGLLKYAAAASSAFSSTAIDVEFTVGSDVAVGEYDVTVNGQLEGSGVDDALLSETTFKVIVVGAHLVTLSEDATEAPEAATAVNVKVERTIAAGTWSTIVLPFEMNANQVKAAFGDDAVIGDLKAWTSETDDNDDVTGILVQFESVSAIEANHPYVIKVSEKVTEFTVEGVDITPEEEPSVEVGKKKTLGSMTGTYVAGVNVPAEALFLNGGKFWYSKGSSKPMKAFRAYFEFFDVLAAYEEAESRINITFDDVTAIKSMKNNGNEDIYTLSGQRVQNAGKGVYIVNGKKVIKK